MHSDPPLQVWVVWSLQLAYHACCRSVGEKNTSPERTCKRHTERPNQRPLTNGSVYFNILTGTYFIRLEIQMTWYLKGQHTDTVVITSVSHSGDLIWVPTSIWTSLCEVSVLLWVLLLHVSLPISHSVPPASSHIPKNLHVRLIENAKVPIGVNVKVNCWLFTCALW